MRLKLFLILVAGVLLLTGCFAKQTPKQADLLIQKAIIDRDATLCSKVNDQFLGERCKSLVDNQLSGDLINEAVTKADPALCAKLAADADRAKCADAVIQARYESSGQKAKDDAAFNKAIQGRDSSICSRISLPDGVEKCKELAVAQKDSDLFDQAVAKDDPALCDTLSTPEAKTKCIEVVNANQKKVVSP